MMLTILPHFVFGARGKFSVYVIDSENGTPISNIKVKGSFLNYSRGWDRPAKDNNVEAWTDSAGSANLSGSTEKGIGGYRIINIPGYYNSNWVEVTFQKKGLLYWDPTDVVLTTRLDRIINPIPLFAKSPCFSKWVNEEMNNRSSTNQTATITNVVASYDLLVGQWLPPYGEGKYADITIEAKTEYLGIDHYFRRFPAMRYKTTYSMRFPHDGDGIVEMPFDPVSSLKIRIAPLDGYGNSLIRWHGFLGIEEQHKTSFNKDRCFAFRIRTKRDSSGNITQAYYGKVYGDLNFMEPNDEPFSYYINLTPNDRNLEFDRKTNLNPNDKRRPYEIAP